MNETLTWLSIAGFVGAFLALLASFGFRRLVVALLAATALSAAVAAAVGWIVFTVSAAFGHGGGDWGGLASLVIAMITTAVVFVLCFLLTMILLALSKREIFRRAPWSPVLLGLSVVGLVLGAGSYVFNSPQFTSTKQLVKNLGRSAMNQEIEDELVRRGSAALPELLAEVRRHPKAENDDPDSYVLTNLFTTLGRIGGAEALVELRGWLKSEASVYVRVAAGTTLTNAGDRESIPLIAELFKSLDSDRDFARPQLLKALGKLKAADQVGTIRDDLFARSPSEPGQSQTIPIGIAALAMIDTEEAWTAIRELSQDPHVLRRQAVMSGLNESPGLRTLAILSLGLEDSDATVREAAYWSLLRVEPKLNASAPPPWNEATAEKMRQAIKELEPSKP